MSFSPLAGIKFVESILADNSTINGTGFSPLAGIKFVESPSIPFDRVTVEILVSVPLRGLSSWKALLNISINQSVAMFQSPCGD